MQRRDPSGDSRHFRTALAIGMAAMAVIISSILVPSGIISWNLIRDGHEAAGLALWAAAGVLALRSGNWAAPSVARIVGRAFRRGRSIPQGHGRTRRGWGDAECQDSRQPAEEAGRQHGGSMTAMTRDQVLETVREARAAGQRAVLPSANLIRADLTGVSLRDATLSGANLTNATLTRVDLADAWLRCAWLRGADLRHADLTNVNLFRADLAGADLTGAILRDADLRDTNLRGADLANTNLTRSWLLNSDLTRASLRNATLTDTDFAHANLTKTDLRDTNLHGATLADTNFAHANLTNANLTGATLVGADLTNAILTRADLTNADLAGADLTDTNLAGANLADTPLEGAHLTPQQLLDTRGLRPGRHGLPQDTWDELLPTSTEQRQLVEHLLNDGWGGTLREAIATVEGLAGR